MHERSLDERLARLEERLGRLESRLGVEPESSPPDAGQAPEPTHFTALPAAPPAGRAHSSSNAARPLHDAEHPLPDDASSFPDPADPGSEQDSLPALPWVVPHRPPPLPRAAARRSRQSLEPIPAPRPAGTLEAQVGLKWAGWVGAVIVVIGAALAVKYAYDHNWFGALPPAARLALLSLGGFGLIAAGEVVYRRVGMLASVGLFGAGVATLFVVSFAGYRYFELYGREPAFVLMGLVTLVGAAVAIRANLVSIGVLSIVGGNVAPIILHDDQPRLVPLMAYLLMLQVVSLVLACWGRESKWWALRGVSLTTICLWMAVPLLDAAGAYGADRGAMLVFSLIYAGLFHAELVLSSLRAPESFTTREPGFAVPVPLGERSRAPEQRGLGVTFSVLVTAAVTVAVLVLLYDRPAIVRGTWTLGLGACCLGLGVLLQRLTRADGPPAPFSPTLGLSVAYRFQAAALLVVAVPVTLSGVWVTTAWAGLALVFALAGATLNLNVSRAAAVLVWMLALAHLALWTVGGGLGPRAAGPGPLNTWVVVLGQPIPAYVVLAALLAVIGHAISAIIREDFSGTSAARESLVPVAGVPEGAGEAKAAAPAKADRAGGIHAPLSGTPESAGGIYSPVVETSGRAGTIHAPFSDLPDRAGDARSEPSDAGPAGHNLNYESRTEIMPRPLAELAYQRAASLMNGVAILAMVVAAGSSFPAIGLTLTLLLYAWVLLGGGQVLRSPEIHPLGLLLFAAAAGKWMLFDTLGQMAVLGRAAGSYQPVYNPAAAVGAGLFVSALALLRLPLRLRNGKSRQARSGDNAHDAPSAHVGGASEVRAACGFAGVLLLLWLITTEIDRYFAFRAAPLIDTPSADDLARARQVTISIVWSVYAVGCVALGFARRVAGLRYFGLALFALTVFKVMLVDLRSVEQGYRILSFLGLGLLLLGTSVLYGKLSPLLLRMPTPARREDSGK